MIGINIIGYSKRELIVLPEKKKNYILLYTPSSL